MSWGEREVRKTRMTSSLSQTPSNICLLARPSVCLWPLVPASNISINLTSYSAARNGTWRLSIDAGKRSKQILSRYKMLFIGVRPLEWPVLLRAKLGHKIRPRCGNVLCHFSSKSLTQAHMWINICLYSIYQGYGPGGWEAGGKGWTLGWLKLWGRRVGKNFFLNAIFFI